MSITLTAFPGSTASGVGSTGTLSLAPEVETVTLVASGFDTADGAAEVTWTSEPGGTLSVPQAAQSGASRTVTMPRPSSTTVFTVTQAGGASADVTIAVDPRVVSEVQIGQWDPRFALAAGVILAVAFFLVLFLIGTASTLVAVPAPGATGTPSPAPSPSPAPTSFSESVRALTSYIALAVGSLLLTLGGFLAAVEVRGRQRAEVRVTTTTSENGLDHSRIKALGGSPAPGVDADAIDSVVKFVDTLKTARGTVLVIVVGLLVFFAGLLGSGAVSISVGG